MNEEYLISGEIASKVRDYAVRLVKRGLSPLEIAERVEKKIVSLGGFPAFPCNICINEIAAHFTPNKGEFRKLKKGDLVKIDLGVHVDGYIADTATTIRVGGGDEEIIKVAEEALQSAIEIIRSGVETREIGKRIEQVIISSGYRVLKGLNGHNIERYKLHAGLMIPNERSKKSFKLRSGDVITVEPFVTEGSGEIKRIGGRIYRVLRDDPRRVRGDDAKNLLKRLSSNFGALPFSLRWIEDSRGIEELLEKLCIFEYPVVLTKDGTPVSQMEHTILVGDNSCEIITL
jgi:methionyl aminopeptidase